MFHVSGRSYLAKNSELIAALIACLKAETKDMLTQDHVLGCLQRLSLKSVLLSGHLGTLVLFCFIRKLKFTALTPLKHAAPISEGSPCLTAEM